MSTTRKTASRMAAAFEEPGEEKNPQLASVRDELLVLQSENKLCSMTVVELRKVMKKLTKSTKGTKQELVSRLEEFLQSNLPSPGTVRQSITVDEERVEKQSAKRVQDGKLVTERSAKRRAKTTTTTTRAVVNEAAIKNFWTVLNHKKVQPEWVAYDPSTMRPQTSRPASSVVKVISWNVNGLRACLKRKDDGEEEEGMSSLPLLAKMEDFDIICLQETKLQEKDVEAIKDNLLREYASSFWTCSTSKLGYSGSAVISRMKPLSVSYGIGVDHHDGEGRVVTVEFDSFYLISVYVPNSGQKLERLTYRTTEWDPAFSAYLVRLQRMKPVVVTGDLNCAHEEIDIHDPNGNKRSAGFTEEERHSFQENLLNKGLVDTFRRQHPCAVGFTYWSYRSNARPQNKGWRLDYFLVSPALVDSVVDSYVLPHVSGSDHCPVGLILNKTI